MEKRNMERQTAYKKRGIKILNSFGGSACPKQSDMISYRLFIKTTNHIKL